MIRRTKHWIPVLVTLFIISILSGCTHMEKKGEFQETQTQKSEVQESAAPAEATPASAPEVQQEVVTVAVGRLNLRAQGTTDSLILSVLKKGDALVVLERKDHWINVQTASGKQGWVAARYTHPPGKAPVVASAPKTSALPKTEAAKPQATPAADSPAAPATTPSTGQTEEPTTPAKPRTEAFSQKEAVALFNHYRNTMAEGDFKAFLACIYHPPEPAGDEPSLEKGTPEEFDQAKEFLLELTPDPAASEILKFDSNDEVALLVIRSDLENPDYITLSALKFVFDKGEWKIFSKFYDNTFPRKDAEADQAAIANDLKNNRELQLAAVEAELRSSTTVSPSTPKPEAIPASAGSAEGELIVNGESTPLRYAYAYMEPGFFDKTTMDTVVILSDIALDEEAVNDWGKRADLEAAGKLHCVELTINTEGRVISRRLRHSAFKASPSGVSGSEVFEPQAADEGVIAGKAYTTSEDDFFGTTYQYRVSFRTQIKPPAEASAEDTAAPTQSSVFNDSPKHAALVEMLKAEGKTEILQTATSVGMNILEDFARVVITYAQEGEAAKAHLFLFKENDTWVAHGELPTHKDHPQVFSELARRYCASRYAHLQGVGYLDDSHENQDPQKRVINMNCDEYENNEWQYHRLSMVYEYDAQKGWHISGAEPYQKPAEKTDKQPDTAPMQADQTASQAEESKTETKPCTSLQECMQMSDLQMAVISSHHQGEARVLELIQAGSDLAHRNKIGDTPLHTAVNASPPLEKIVLALLEAGAEVDAPNEYGYSPLHNLAQGAVNKEAPIAVMLIAAGADVNLKDHYGMTPLHHMTINKLGCQGTEVARVLIDAGGDANMEDKYGETPLAAARKNGCHELAAIFEKAGTN